MRNLLKSTLYLTVFALAGILFQISCSNSENTKSTMNTTNIGKIVFGRRPVSSTVFTSWQIWTCNYDGSNLNQIPITLPSNVIFNISNGQTNVKLSPDGQKVFFVTVTNPSGGSAYASIYSCNIDGTNLNEVAVVNDDNIELGGAY